MRLADYLDSHSEQILSEWRTRTAITPAPAPCAHDRGVLAGIALALRQADSTAPQPEAQLHGAARSRDGGSIAQLVGEYRALRGVVLRYWSECATGQATLADDAARFHEAVDQAIADAVESFNREFSHDHAAREAINRELMLNRGRLEYASRLSNVGFWYCDLPFDVLEWDERVKEHFFFAPSAKVVIGDFYDRIHPEDRERTRTAIDASISSREAYDIVYRTRHPSTGEVKWIRALGGTDYAADGSPIHFDGLTVDVTAQTLEEMRVAESEARHRGVIANMDEAFSLFDANFNFIDVNDAACQLVGIARAQLLGSNHWQQFPGTYDSAIGQMYLQVLKDGTPRFLEHRYVFENGRAVWFEVRAFKVGAGVAALFRDVTQRVEMIEALQGADKRKDEFLAMLAHELRNPLAPIMTAGEILARAFDAQAPHASAIAVIRRQASHMTRLIDDLLDVARVTQGRIQLHRVTLDIAEALAQAFEICDSQLQAKQQQLVIATATSSPLYVEGDAARLIQCVANILSNAIKYTDAQGQISVSLRAEPAWAIIEVADTGSGIPAALLPEIFELFVQSPRTLDRSQGGLGVGLAIVKRLVDMHGGRVRAFSPGEGSGSTFEIRLPRVAAPQRSPESAAAAGAASGRILLVDDNVDAAESLAMLLEMQGHELLAVHDAHEALARVEAFRPDVMLIDIGLPGMDGYELARKLDETLLGQGLRKIALTGYGQPEDKRRAFEAGFDAHLVKPVDLQALERAIAGLA